MPCSLIWSFPVTAEARVDRLIVIDDFGQNADKQDRYERLRALARDRYPTSRGQRVICCAGRRASGGCSSTNA